MIHRYLFVLFAGLCGTMADAQERTHLGLQLQAYLETADPKGAVDLFLSGDPAELTQAVAAHGGVVRKVTKGWALARVPVSEVKKLDKEPALRGVQFSIWHGVALNDSMRVKAHVEQVHQGLAPLPAAYNGDGVIMGVIDTGLDLTHPDFKTVFGRTRVLKYWDQTMLSDPDHTPPDYGYGQQWDSTAINAGLCPATDPSNQFGHGTTVAGTAAGGGMATDHYQGVAPKADIVIVANAQSASNWTATVVDACDYIFHVADSLDRPAAINLSLGSYYGSHDGLDPATLMIKDMLQTPGRMLVCAAGNSGALAPYHLRTNVTSDTAFTWFRYGAFLPVVGSGVYYDLWADTADFSHVHYSIGADRRNSGYAERGHIPYRIVQGTLGQVVTDTLRSPSGYRLGVVSTYAELRDGQYHMEVAIANTDSADNYYYRFSTTGTGRYDVWSTSTFGTSEIIRTVPTVAEFPPIAHYVQPDNQMSIVDAWACSPDVLTVGNYYNEQVYTDMDGNVQNLGNTEGNISANSSHGPARTGVVKPDVAAPGDITFSPGPLLFIQQLITNGQSYKIAPGMFHLRGGGTSIASPCVAGTAALYLEKCPHATHLEIRDAINSTAFGDAQTGALPNVQFGHGRINAFDALVTSNFQVPITGPLVVCEGDSVELQGPGGMSSYIWNTGATTQAAYSHGGDMVLNVANASGCLGTSDSVNVIMVPLPPAPIITQNGNDLLSTTAAAYQWYFGGTAINGAVQQGHEATEDGDYQVQIFDENGCSAFSNTLSVVITGIGDHAPGGYRVWPVPATDKLSIATADATRPSSVDVLDQHGAKVPCPWTWTAGRIDLNVEKLATGGYNVRIVRNGGTDLLRFLKQ